MSDTYTIIGLDLPEAIRQVRILMPGIRPVSDDTLGGIIGRSLKLLLKNEGLKKIAEQGHVSFLDLANAEILPIWRAYYIRESVNNHRSIVERDISLLTAADFNALCKATTYMGERNLIIDCVLFRMTDRYRRIVNPDGIVPTNDDRHDDVGRRVSALRPEFRADGLNLPQRYESK